MVLMQKITSFIKDRHYNWLETRFDARYGTDTCGIDTDLAGLGATGPHLAHAEWSEPVHPILFSRMLGAVSLDKREYTFVDYGCGKGRAVLLAAECGFGRVIGIELATGLAETARANVQAYAMRRPDSGPIDIRCMDAADFMPPEGKLFCFFYNPFGPEVLRKVVDLIELSHRRWGHPLVIGYRNPVHSYVFEEADFLECVVKNRSFAIYKSP